MDMRIAGRARPPAQGTFVSNERGSLTIFSLFVIVCMLIVGGMAVDFMRQESTRARLQSTLDRAILAAADMDQKLDPTAVVQDYFARAGVDGYNLKVEVEEGLTSRRVSATSTKTLDSYFLNFLGINTLKAPALGTAEESLSNIEISLVLDVSTSMNENKKIDNLKVAAKEFVDTIFAQTVPGKTTISIVPYSTQVNAGADLLGHYSVTKEHDYSNCVDFSAADYALASLSTTRLLQRTGHFDPTARDSTRKPSSFVCRTTGGTEVLPVSDSPKTLKAKIDSLVANGYTSIEIGVKWGSALLDPSARPAIDGMVADKKAPAGARGRPYDYDGSKTMKVIVVMTDGINTTQWYLDPRFSSGLSDVWRDPGSDKLSYKLPVGYYIPGTGISASPAGGKKAVQLSYPELWATSGVRYNAARWADVLGGNSGALWNTTYALWTGGLIDAVTGVLKPGVFSTVEGTAKDARLQAVCKAAKAQGIKIYSIGFEVTDDSAKVMEQCATTTSHFFRVGGKDISQAFRSIANDIGKLRLTQ